MMHSLLHRIWWDGCGYLPLSSCWEVRNDILFTAFLNLVPSLYCIWIVWSSYYLILDGDLQGMVLHARKIICSPCSDLVSAALWLAGFNFGDPRQFDKSQYQVRGGGEDRCLRMLWFSDAVGRKFPREANWQREGKGRQR